MYKEKDSVHMGNEQQQCYNIISQILGEQRAKSWAQHPNNKIKKIRAYGCRAVLSDEDERLNDKIDHINSIMEKHKNNYTQILEELQNMIKTKELFQDHELVCTYLIPNDRYIGKGYRAVVKNNKKIHQNNEQYIDFFYNGSSGACTTNKKTPNDLKIGNRYGDDADEEFSVFTREECDLGEKQGYIDILLTNGKICRFPFYHKINENVDHLTYILDTHGDNTRQISTELLSLNRIMRRVKQEDFNKLKTFYWRPHVCYGAYFDHKNSIFRELQNKLSQCKDNHPKVFVSLIKPKYAVLPFLTADNKHNKNAIGRKRLPFLQGATIDIVDVEENKDKYFDYYLVEKDKIYKIPHELAHNRVALLDGTYKEKVNGQWIKKTWDEKFDELVKEGKITLLTQEDQKKEFKEWYEFVENEEAIEEKKPKKDEEYRKAQEKRIKEEEKHEELNKNNKSNKKLNDQDEEEQTRHNWPTIPNEVRQRMQFVPKTGFQPIDTNFKDAFAYQQALRTKAALKKITNTAQTGINNNGVKK